MIKRELYHTLTKGLQKNKVLIVLGARQTGKTTLVKEIATTCGLTHRYLNADDIVVRNQLSDVSLIQLKQIIGENQLLIIDEAQRIVNIGITLKLIHDNYPGTKLLVTGSSALELTDKINEPLTGRKLEHHLYPISWQELVRNDYLNAQQQFKIRLVYGMYPDVISELGNEKSILENLSDSFLFKDILSLHTIRKPELLMKLLEALAYQVGNEVSLNELSNMLEVDKNTISNYIQLLEKSWIIFKLRSFSRNLRNEITSKNKIYFYDNGIRNAIIGNYRPIDNREDRGALWESFLISERIKFNHYNQNWVKNYFWRTHQQQELDYLEEADGNINAFEFKWGNKTKLKIPKTFTETYKEAQVKLINQDNYQTFISSTHEQ